ncbi:hypothetical protein [Bradyrhizobium japonicum]|uniref:hypothetical protein n=1 Tax=Bradyrhizobium japonicum TaxID=375 RepID=UPI000674842A|nr:hypothetical protein [Bradyrhizobium japonicum]
MWRVSDVAFWDPEQTLRRDTAERAIAMIGTVVRIRLAVPLTWRSLPKQNGRKDRIPNLVSIAVQCVLAATASEKMRAVQPHAFVVANPKNKPIPDWGRLNTRLDRLGGRGRAAGDIEDLASKLYCRRADSDFACRDWSDRGTASKHRNAEYKSG